MKDNTPDQQTSVEKEFALESIISTAVQVPGVKVDRKKFLAASFSSDELPIQRIIDLGPVEAGVSQDALASISHNLILKRTSQSSAASFISGLPGGLAMAATIPADVLQFFAMALRLAQELSYLYGAQDLWQDGQLDDERVKTQLLLYCGVMFGVSGAVSGVRILSTQIAKTTLKKLPQQTLTKTFWYPIIKQIGKAIGVKITKSTVAKGVSKAIPVLGGVLSGGLNFASMMPMANRLQAALDSAAFVYTEEDLAKDIIEIAHITVDDRETDKAAAPAKEIVDDPATGGKKTHKITSLFAKKAPNAEEKADEDVFKTLNKLSKLKERGIITEEEFNSKKKELLSRL